jgi:hypothetical protein
LLKLYNWFLHKGNRGPGWAYESLLDFLADWFRLEALKADWCKDQDPEDPLQLAEAWVRAWMTNPALEDDLGRLMEEHAGVLTDRLGQFLTPWNLVRMMTAMTSSNEPVPEGEWRQYLDPACGTGRFCMAAMDQDAPHDEGRVVYKAVDLDMRMVRTTILNLHLVNFWRIKHGHRPAPFRVIHANSLAVDLGHAATWRHANKWTQPDWRTLPQRRAEHEASPSLADFGASQGYRTMDEAKAALAEDAAAAAPAAMTAPRRVREAATLEAFGFDFAGVRRGEP